MLGPGLSQRQSLRQTLRTIPEQIVAGEILQLPCQALLQRIEAEFQTNPALSLEEAARCPICDTPIHGSRCEVCGSRPAEEDVPTLRLEDWEQYRQHSYDSVDFDSYSTVAHGQTLKDDLRSQWLAVAGEDERAIGLFIIECLNEDGYFTEPLYEITERFLLSMSQAERIVKCVQTLEPAGVGARDLRECLLLQAERADGPDSIRELARRILSEHWDDLTQTRLSAIATGLGVKTAQVEEALAWIRSSLDPYPGRSHRNDWSHLAPRDEPRVVPDAVIRPTDSGFVVEVVEAFHARLGIDTEYGRLLRWFEKHREQRKTEYEHLRNTVSSAKALIEALAVRRQTLHRILTAVVEAQEEFLRRGSAHLKPLMQKTIAAELGIHESTVSRALADKMVQLPSGETIPTSRFFEDAAPAKEAIRELIGREDRARPLSDSKLAQMLEERGHKIARRTVAKYREALQIPPVEQRRQSA